MRPRRVAWATHAASKVANFLRRNCLRWWPYNHGGGGAAVGNGTESGCIEDLEDHVIKCECRDISLYGDFFIGGGAWLRAPCTKSETCPECGQITGNISSHMKRVHGVTLNEWREINAIGKS